MSIEQILLEESKAAYNAIESVEDVLFSTLVKEQYITQKQHRTIIMEASKADAEMLLEAPRTTFVNATANSVTIMPDGVVITPDQFRAVWTDYDRYPTVEKVYIALGFTRDDLIMTQKRDSLINHLGGRNTGRNNLVDWYNSNYPKDKLVKWGDRSDLYAKANLDARGGDDGQMYQPDGSPTHINPGSRGRNSSKIDQLNKTDILVGEFYNNITQISPRRWQHWAKFWDQRLNSVQPNKRGLFGSLIGKAWKKTFLLGYRVDRKTFYEVWYNSLNSSFAIYDKNGVQQGDDIVTLQEAIQNLVHVLAQKSQGDETIFVGGTHGQNMNQIAKSMQNVVRGDLDRSVGAVRREDELLAKELANSKADYTKRDSATRTRRIKRVQAGRDYQANSAGLSKGELTALRRAEKAIKRYEQELKLVEDELKKVPPGDTMSLSTLRKARTEITRHRDNAQAIYDTIKAQNAKVDDSGDVVVGNNINATMLAAISSRAIDKAKTMVKQAIASARGGVQDVMTDLGQQQEELDNIRKGKEAARILKQDAEAIQRASEDVIKKSRNNNISKDVIEKQKRLAVVKTAQAIALFNATQEVEVWQEIDRSVSNVTVGNVQAMRPDKAKKKWRNEAARLEQEEQALRDEIEAETKQHNAEFEDDINDIKKKRTDKRKMNESFLDLANDDVEVEDFVPNSRETDRYAQSIKREADNSVYNASLITKGLMGDIKSYDVTKVSAPSKTLTSIIANAPGVGRWLRGRTDPVENPFKGIWSRTKMAVLGEQYRADFISGFTIADRVNMEIWYIMEPGKDNKIITHYLVYDVGARKVIRSYLPYYRNAIQVVAAKLNIPT